MTTLRTPTDSQWRWLCEKAEGFSVKEHVHGVTVTMQHPSGESSFPLWVLPNDTDALMRLCDEVFESWVLTNHTKLQGHKEPFVRFEAWNGEWYATMEQVIRGNAERARRLAACDILAQLAVAEGI